MNLVFNPLEQPECLRPEYVFFYDKKKNMIIDGVFSKIMYSNEHVSCAGITLNTPFEYQNPRLVQYNSQFRAHASSSKNTLSDTSVDKCKSRFSSDPATDGNVKWDFQLTACEKNKTLVAMFTQLEEAILTQYKLMSGLKHSLVLSLGYQLSYEHIIVHGASNELPEHVPITLKISGVWETSTHIGITYKLCGGA